MYLMIYEMQPAACKEHRAGHPAAGSMQEQIGFIISNAYFSSVPQKCTEAKRRGDSWLSLRMLKPGLIGGLQKSIPDLGHIR